jgi:NADPH-dependent curcumin reductase CurA
MVKAKQVQLTHYPTSAVAANDFKIIDKTLPALSTNEILVKNKFMSVDPYMRIRMQNKSGYMPAFQLNQPLPGHAIGQVIESKDDTIQPGSWVTNFSGWSDSFITTKENLSVVPTIKHMHQYLSVLGMPGMTAYIGLLHFGKPKKGDHVFISAASGAVGSIACQIATLKGCRVIGSAGRDDKCQWLKNNTGIERCINYKQENVSKIIPSIFPQGIDIYFDNVGGDHLTTSFNQMADFGRLVMCGMISQYNTPNAITSLDLFSVISKQLVMSGFLLKDHMNHQQQFLQEMTSWMQQGLIKSHETIIQGIENAPQAFIDMLTGKHLGKVIVEI